MKVALLGAVITLIPLANADDGVRGGYVPIVTVPPPVTPTVADDPLVRSAHLTPMGAADGIVSLRYESFRGFTHAVLSSSLPVFGVAPKPGEWAGYLDLGVGRLVSDSSRYTSTRLGAHAAQWSGPNTENLLDGGFSWLWVADQQFQTVNFGLSHRLAKSSDELEHLGSATSDCQVAVGETWVRLAPMYVWGIGDDVHNGLAASGSVSSAVKCSLLPNPVVFEVEGLLGDRSLGIDEARFMLTTQVGSLNSRNTKRPVFLNGSVGTKRDFQVSLSFHF